MDIGLLVGGIILMAFFCEYMDADLEMGYGTALTPSLLILGFRPLEVAPTILLSQFVSSLTAGFFHHRQRRASCRTCYCTDTAIEQMLKLAMIWSAAGS